MYRHDVKKVAVGLFFHYRFYEQRIESFLKNLNFRRNRPFLHKNAFKVCKIPPWGTVPLSVIAVCMRRRRAEHEMDVTTSSSSSFIQQFSGKCKGGGAEGGRGGGGVNEIKPENLRT